MSSLNPTDPDKRRLLLRVLVKIMLWASLLVCVWVGFSPLFKNNSPVNARVVETSFDVTGFSPGEVELVEWFGKPLIIVRRDPSQEQSLTAADSATLQDPHSENSVQSAEFENPLRSATPGWFVTLGLGTGSGCALTYMPSLIRAKDGVSLTGGFFDRCDSSHYDLAGRVLTKQSSRKNTAIPKWRFVAGSIIVSTQKP